MTVTLVGSPGNARSTTTSVTGTYGQSPTAGNLLVAVVTGTGSTAATPTVTCSTSGWFRLLDAGPWGNNGTVTGHALVDVWGKVATGGDAAPVFTVGVSGTVTTSASAFELAGANTTSPLNQGYAIYESGSASATLSSLSASAWAPLAPGEFGISAFAQERAAATVSWTESGTGWTSGYSDGATNSTGHRQVNYQAGPPASAFVADSGHFSVNTTAFGAGIVFTITNPGINEDPSQGPAEGSSTLGGTGASVTTASFSPPAGSLVVVNVSLAYLNSGGVPAVTVSDSGSHTWTAGPSLWNSNFSYAGIFTHYFAAAPGAITITAANSDAAHGTQGILADVRVITGAAPVQAGAASNTASAASGVTAVTGSVTTTKAGSLVFISSAYDAFTATVTPAATTTTLSFIEDTTDQGNLYSGRAANWTTTPGAVTLGYTATAVTGGYAWAALEVLPVSAAALPRSVIALQAVNRASTY